MKIELTSECSLVGYCVGTGVGLDEGSDDGVYIKLSEHRDNQRQSEWMR